MRSSRSTLFQFLLWPCLSLVGWLIASPLSAEDGEPKKFPANSPEHQALTASSPYLGNEAFTLRNDYWKGAVSTGTGTALFAAMTTRVQTDIKSALAYASLTQVGIIVAEIGFGLRYIALIHIIGHACLRTLQLLRAPTLLRDYDMLRNAIGDHLPHSGRFLPASLTAPSARWW